MSRALASPISLKPLGRRVQFWLLTKVLLSALVPSRKGLWALTGFSRRKYPCPGESHTLDVKSHELLNRVELTAQTGFEFRLYLDSKDVSPENRWAMEQYSLSQSFDRSR